MKNAIKYFFKSIIRLLFKLHVLTPKIVVLMDGGICSQMYQYLIGQQFAEKGYKVMYDLYFFENCSKDPNGIFARNFDLLKAYPYLRFTSMTNMERRIYMLNSYHFNNYYDKDIDQLNYLKSTPPAYLGGYYHAPLILWKEMIPAYFKSDIKIMDKANQKAYLEIIKTKDSVAVHVRRGDLNVAHPAYGTPASIQYFISAIKYMNAQIKAPTYFFFSDEPRWVKEKLIPQLPLENNYRISDLNGSDKGYMDLFLIASCKHQITSKGSLGKFGALMSDNPNKLVTLCDDKTEYEWKYRLDNPIFL